MKFFLFLTCITICWAEVEFLTRNTPITFQTDAWTTGQRTSAIPQISCVGDSYLCEHHPVQTMLCTFLGGESWRCETDTPPGIKLGKTAVSCEGYPTSKDFPRIWKGSCAVEFNWVEVPRMPVYHISAEQEQQQRFESICIGVAFLVIVASVLYVSLFGLPCWQTYKTVKSYKKQDDPDPEEAKSTRSSSFYSSATSDSSFRSHRYAPPSPPPAYAPPASSPMMTSSSTSPFESVSTRSTRSSHPNLRPRHVTRSMTKKQTQTSLTSLCEDCSNFQDFYSTDIDTCQECGGYKESGAYERCKSCSMRTGKCQGCNNMIHVPFKQTTHQKTNIFVSTPAPSAPTIIVTSPTPAVHSSTPIPLATPPVQSATSIPANSRTAQSSETKKDEMSTTRNVSVSYATTKTR